MADTGVRYLPRDLAEDLRDLAPDQLSSNEMYRLCRIAEEVYARGYADGHQRGFANGTDYRQRPSINDLNRVRDALKGEEPDHQDGHR